MNVILFGFKGCGKTYFGQRLALALECSFVDTDTLLIEVYRKEGGKESTTPAIYRDIGETAFRQMETRVVGMLSEIKDSVIALGGGTVLNPANVDALKKIGHLVFLDTALATILSRSVNTALGPLEPLYHQRRPIYASLSEDRISIDALDDTAVIKALTLIAKQRNPHGFK